MVYGTLSVLDTLAASSTATVAAFGEDKAYEYVSIALAAHDRILSDMLTDIVEPTSERLVRIGGVSGMTAEELDEFGVPSAQKASPGAPVGYPLRRTGNALQWTRDWMATKAPSELVAQVNALMTADRQALIRNIKRALFLSTNYTFVDHLVDHMELPVKRLANADSFAIPPGPDGTTFDATTHTHYVARAGSLAASDITGAITNARQHYNTGEVRLYINSAQETAVRGFTSNFTPYMDARIIVGSGTTRGAADLDVSNTTDRAIGLFDEAEVWVKPWVPANYMAAVVIGAGVEKPLAARSPSGNGVGTLELVGDYDNYPLRARIWKRDVGFGVQNRVGAALLYIGDTSWADPTIT